MCERYQRQVPSAWLIPGAAHPHSSLVICFFTIGAPTYSLGVLSYWNRMLRIRHLLHIASKIRDVIVERLNFESCV